MQQRNQVHIDADNTAISLTTQLVPPSLPLFPVIQYCGQTYNSQNVFVMFLSKQFFTQKEQPLHVHHQMHHESKL